MKIKFDKKKFLYDTLYFICGSFLYSFGIYTFARNAKFATGGISGLALILTRFTGLPIGLLTLLLNIPLIVFSVRTLGTYFVVRSGYVMIIEAFFTDMVFPRLPSYHGSPLLAAMFTGVLIGAGLAIIYMRGGSTGGSDFIVMSIKKTRPHFSIARISLIIDIFIILLGGIVFKNVDAVLYGILSSFTCTMMMDNMLYGAGSSKMAIIITDHGQQIADAIAVEVDRGSTLVPAKGGYTGIERDMLFCICSKSQIYRVRTAARAIDPSSMVMVTEASEVFGEGFTQLQIPGNEIPGSNNN